MNDSENVLTEAQEIFIEADKNHQKLIRDILKDERDVMHLKRRSDIYHRIYEHVRRIIR